MAAECCSSCEYQRTVGYPSTSWASCTYKLELLQSLNKHRCFLLSVISLGHILIVAIKAASSQRE